MFQISLPTIGSPVQRGRLGGFGSRIINSGFLALSLLFGVPNLSAQSQPTPEDMVNALNGVFGRHAKTRGSHAKGFCVAGKFIPSAEGKDFAESPLFSGGTIPVTARFSIGGGNPNASDRSRSVRGLGARFHISKTETLDLVLISAPTFFAATPAQFVSFLKVRTADPSTGRKDPTKIKAFNDANPNVMPHLNYLSSTPPPASYATTPYFSTHAFIFAAKEKKKQAARWILEPAGGFHGLSADEELSLPDSFLEKELRQRLAESPAVWTVFLQIPTEGDSLVDPSAVWPESRQKIAVGRLVIDELVAEDDSRDCTGFVFDPNRLPTGITPSNDPILAIRSPAYGISFGRRSQN